MSSLGCRTSSLISRRAVFRGRYWNVDDFSSAGSPSLLPRPLRSSSHLESQYVNLARFGARNSGSSSLLEEFDSVAGLEADVCVSEATLREEIGEVTITRAASSNTARWIFSSGSSFTICSTSGIANLISKLPVKTLDPMLNRFARWFAWWFCEGIERILGWFWIARIRIRSIIRFLASRMLERYFSCKY
jgi:hypothetical protein